jgi:hypothetical protein
MAERPVVTRSFAASLFLMARGHEPLAAAPARNGSGGIVYLFAYDAAAALDDFHLAKTRLDALSLKARDAR